MLLLNLFVSGKLDKIFKENNAVIIQEREFKVLVDAFEEIGTILELLGQYGRAVGFHFLHPRLQPSFFGLIIYQDNTWHSSSSSPLQRGLDRLGLSLVWWLDFISSIKDRFLWNSSINESTEWFNLTKMIEFYQLVNKLQLDGPEYDFIDFGHQLGELVT